MYINAGKERTLEKKAKNGRQNYDWVKVKHEYITVPESSYTSLAKKYEINFSTLAIRARKERWFDEKKKFQQRVAKKALTTASDRLARKMAKEIESASKLSSHIHKALSDGEQFQRHLVTTGDMETGIKTEEKIFQKFDTRSIRDITASLKTLEELKRSLYEIQKADALNKQWIEKERLELEKARFEFEKEKAERQQGLFEDSEVYGVVVLPEVKKDDSAEE